MSDIMKVQPFDLLLNWILQEYEENRSIFGLHESLFYRPKKESRYATEEMFGHYLATPIGPAAGPHTQLTQNILCAWLSGGRFIELKTVQIMDELEIPRPCIDMEDEGYNVEWSQELKLDQSAHEYIKAWALIHILRRMLGFEGRVPFGTVFNMSVGYNLEGITSPPMVAFMDRMEDASSEIAEIRSLLQDRFPRFADIEIPSRLTNSVTLSTMHGCPPDEIEQIARYLLVERGLHTTVKLNPTLLGRERVLGILHDHLGFREIHIPEAVFEHDLKYDRAVQLITSLQGVAAGQNLTFGVKLSNTLAMANHKGALPGDEMYMSGRALYPITINLYHKLAREFEGGAPTGAGHRLNVSYSAGADALNVTAILATGARPITVASDLLKPGGYSRLLQYLENLEAGMRERGARDLEELARDKMKNLAEAAAEALVNPRYHKDYQPYDLPKVQSGLDLFDCVVAPCIEQCAVAQDVPEYAWLIAQGEYDRALEVILSRNPLPGVTGYVCTHLCQTRCTRSNYDQPVAIRALKRFAAEQGQVALPKARGTDFQVAVVGSGPSGLAAAYFLALNGVQATVFEAREVPGGMLAIAPYFRIPPEVVQADIDRIAGLGVKLELNHRVTALPQELLAKGFDAVYLATGFQRDARLDIEGIDGQGVYTALRLLEGVALGGRPELGEKVLVIGGGNTAMDCARTAQRLTGRPTTVVYRRSRAEMPAEVEEIEWLLEEGNHLEALSSPTRVILQNGRVVALECVRNELGEPGEDGRRRPVRIPGSEFQIPADSIILAIGQSPDLAFLDGSGITFRSDGAVVVDPATGTSVADVYAGGDVVRGPAIIIQACADGRRAAEAICEKLGLPFQSPEAYSPTLSSEDILQVKGVRAKRLPPLQPAMLPVPQRRGFAVVEQGYDEATARAEAARCLQCSTLCDKCVEVCPNRANYTYLIEPVDWRVPRLSCQNGRLRSAGEEAFRVTQRRQIIHIDDFCNECGNCAAFCVHPGKPYTEKPRLFLQRSDFEGEDDNAFTIEGSTIWRLEGGRQSTLSADPNGITFENAQVRVNLSPDFTITGMELKEPFEGTFSLREAAEMALILQGITSSLPFLTA
jgi:putative selenate reductase